MLIGPGNGTEDTTREFLSGLLGSGAARKKPAGRIGFVPGDREKSKQDKEESKWPAVVLDADGLKLLAKIKDWHKLLPPQAILTPHPGEMSVLTGLSVDEIQQHRQGTAASFAKLWGHV